MAPSNLQACLNRFDFSSLSIAAIDIQFASYKTKKSNKHNKFQYEHEAIPWSLYGTLVFTLGCLYSYYLTVIKYSRYPSWYIFPMISFCGCYPIEQPLWKCTFIFAAIGQTMAQFTIHQTQIYQKFLIHTPEWLRMHSKWWLATHAMATGMVGVFHLTVEQCLDGFNKIGPNAMSMENVVDSSATAHYIFAMIAGGNGVIGVLINCYLYYKAFEYAEKNQLQKVIDVQTLKYIFKFKIIFAVLMTSGLIGFCCVGPIIIYYTGYLTQNMANFMSFMEWLLCIPMGLYDGCISIENWFVVEGLNNDNFALQDNEKRKNSKML